MLYYQYVPVQLNFVLFLQVTVIKNLAEEEKKDAKAFLKQQPFAKPGTFVRNDSIYQPITDSREGSLGQAAWVQKSKDCDSAQHPCCNMCFARKVFASILAPELCFKHDPLTIYTTVTSFSLLRIRYKFC